MEEELKTVRVEERSPTQASYKRHHNSPVRQYGLLDSRQPWKVGAGTLRSTLFDRGLFYVLSVAAVRVHFSQLLNKLPSQSIA